MNQSVFDGRYPSFFVHLFLYTTVFSQENCGEAVSISVIERFNFLGWKLISYIALR